MEFRIFPSLCSIYRCFIQNYTEIAAPIYELLEGKQLSKYLALFSEEQDRSYRLLIKAMKETLVLLLLQPVFPC